MLRIRDLVPFWRQDPVWVKGKIRDEQPGSYFLELGNHPWVEILKFFDADPVSEVRDGNNSERDEKKSDPEAGITVPDPQHWEEGKKKSGEGSNKVKEK